MQSLLFVPGHKEKMLRAAPASGADILLIDLEDSVQPASNKAVAREAVSRLLKEGVFSKSKVFVRVNDLQSGDLVRDLTATIALGVSGFLYPKASTAGDIIFFDKLLEAMEYDLGLEVGNLQIMVLIETAAAVLNCSEICSASKRIVAAAFGSEDYLAEIEGIGGQDNIHLNVPRAMIVLGARAAGVLAIDTVFIDIADIEGLHAQIRTSVDLGFDGMLALHPRQVSHINEGYKPSPIELQAARKTLELYDAAQKTGSGVAYVDGVFVGPPLVRRAKKLLDKRQ
jgi:citrate lyase subunit beta/citryl-CoA lyase